MVVMTQRFATFIALLVLSIGCGQPALPEAPPDSWLPKAVQSLPDLEPFGPGPTLTAERSELLKALSSAGQRWRTTSPTAYRLTVSRLCFCQAATPFESTVRRGVVVLASGGVRTEARTVEAEIRTVETLFAEAERLIRSNVDDVKVSFDPQFGYPTVIDVDWYEGVTDDEWTWRAKLSVID
jgi:hypothetical protein